MVDEPILPQVAPAKTLSVQELSQLAESQAFFANPIQFNATIWQGFNIMLKKLTTIEEQLKKLQDKNGN